MSETATFFLPILASLLMAVVLALLGYLLLVPRLEERLKALREYFDQAIGGLTLAIGEMKTQLAAHAKDEKDAAHDCEAERKQIESQLLGQANQNAKKIAVLEQRSYGHTIVE